MTTELLTDLRRLHNLQTRVVERRLARWWADPVQWVTDCLPSLNLADYQTEELTKLGENRRVAVRGPRGSGKTAPASAAILWFATTRELAGADWKVPSTAGSWNQLSNYLWPEIHKWSRRINWDRLGLSPWRLGQELLSLNIRLKHGEAFGKATDDPNLIEGAHADNMLVVIDEGKSVVEGVWDAVEGFFSNPGDHYAFALSTPGAPVGRFYDIHARRAGYEDWWPIHVTIEQAIEQGRVTQEWVDQRERQWGRGSQLFRCHVLAEFAGEEDGVIPLAWIEAAIERWKENEDRRATIVAADIGESQDETVIALRADWRINQLLRYAAGDPLTQADRIARHTVKGGRVVADAIGIGSGTVASLRRQAAAPENRWKVEGFVASERTMRKDRSGELGFINVRSAAWWNLRELLDPLHGELVELPADDKLVGDLAAPRWREAAGGKIQVESKDDIRKRLGRSTDAGDAVVMAFWEEKARKSLAGMDLSSGLTR